MESDLKKPLISKFIFNDKIHRVEYEGLHTIYFECGIFGHTQEHCPTLKSNKASDEQTCNSKNAKSKADVVTPPIGNPMEESSRPEIESKYGKRMLGPTAPKHGQKITPTNNVCNSKQPGKGEGKFTNGGTNKVINGSRYDILSHMENGHNHGMAPNMASPNKEKAVKIFRQEKF